MVTAWELAGAEVDLRHINEVAGPGAADKFDSYSILGIPGGFAFGDDLGAGKLLANELLFRLKEPFARFVETGRPVLGVCNGFQALAKTGIFGDLTLLPNRSGHFECRWVTLKNANNPSFFLRGIEQIKLPVAHGEGCLTLGESPEPGWQAALRYTDEKGDTSAAYPANPNGSAANLAGVTNPTGTVLGLMPHPERFVSAWQHPQWTRLGLTEEGEGLQIFRNAVQYAAKEL